VFSLVKPSPERLKTAVDCKKLHRIYTGCIFNPQTQKIPLSREAKGDFTG
jgi:hypothetical protein